MVWLPPIFFLISLIYSTVGLGGGSAYIAVMVLFDISKNELPIIALACNIIVAGTAFARYSREGYFHWRLFWPFAISSIPFAYIGGSLSLSDKLFSAILAGALTLAAARMLFLNPPTPPFFKGGTISYPPLVKGGDGGFKLWHFFSIGAILGFLAGITGIGGGIYLIPAIVLLKLAGQKEASAVASLFIVVNSASGLLGHLPKGFIDRNIFLPLAFAVLVGGFIGSKIGASRLQASQLQKIAALIMLAAAAKLIF